MIDSIQDSPNFPKEKHTYCKKHHSDKIFIFCVAKDCNVPLCINCLNDHCLNHHANNTFPRFMELNEILKTCDEKLQNFINEVTSKVDSIKNNPENQLKRQISEKELEKILKSKEFLINFIEKYYQDIQETWLLATKPLETRLEQKLAEMKIIQESLSGPRSIETICKIHVRNLDKELDEIIQNFSSNENIKDNPKITIEYARVNSNFKEELQKFIQIASPTKSIASAISKESEVSTQSSGIQVIQNILQNQTMKFNNLSEAYQRNSEMLQKVTLQNNGSVLSKTPSKILEEISKPVNNRLTFSAFVDAQSSEEKGTPDTPNLMNTSNEEDNPRKKQFTIGSFPENPMLAFPKSHSVFHQESVDKSPSKIEGKCSVYRQKRSLMKESQADQKLKENDFPLVPPLLNNEKTPPMKLISQLTSNDLLVISDFKSKIPFSTDTNLLGSSPPRFVEEKKIPDSVPSNNTQAESFPSKSFNLNFFDKIQEITKAIDKKNDSLISNFNSFVEEDEGFKTPYSIVPSTYDNEIDCLLFDKSENENSLLNSSAYACCDDEKNDKPEFFLSSSDYFQSYCKRKYLCFFPWRTKEIHFLNLDSLDQQSKETKFEIVKLDLPFNIPDYHSTTITPEGEIYLIGGRNGEDPNIKYQDTWSFIIETRSFFPKSHMKIKRDSHSACFVNGFIYVMGGVTIDTNGNKIVIRNCEKFDPKANKWSDIADLPLPLCNQSSTAFSGRYIYTFGGRSQNQKISNNILRYDTFSNKWMTIIIKKDAKVKFNLTSQSACCQINHSQILVFGGYQTDKRVSNQTFIFEIGSSKEAGEKEVFNIKNLDKNNTTFAAPFWDKQVFIQNNTIYCLQNVVAHNNPKVSFNAARRIVLFDGKNWVNLN